MCERCAAQYRDVADRRFHAQPVACPQCGPKIWLTDPAGKTLRTGTDEVIAETVRLLRAGKIVAIKGIGGFHLACDALNNEAVLAAAAAKAPRSQAVCDDGRLVSKMCGSTPWWIGPPSRL